MGKGKFNGFPGGGNMNNMLRQAQKMQANMEKMQEELETKEVEASAGGGMVTVKMTGKKKLTEVVIKPEAVDPEDLEMLQDLVLVAVNDALGKVDEMTEQEMNKITGGISMPGLF